MNLVAALYQLGNESEIRGNMPGASAAGKNNCRHNVTFLFAPFSDAAAIIAHFLLFVQTQSVRDGREDCQVRDLMKEGGFAGW